MATNIYPVNIDVPEQATDIAVCGEILRVAFHRSDETYDADAELAVIEALQEGGVTLPSFRATGTNVRDFLIAVAPGIIKYLEDLKESISGDDFSDDAIDMTNEPNTNATS